MGSTLSVKGQGPEISLDITSANVDVGTPNNSMAKSTNIAATLCITGKLTHNNTEIVDRETLKICC